MIFDIPCVANIIILFDYIIIKCVMMVASSLFYFAFIYLFF